MRKPKGLYILDTASFGLIYGPQEQREIAELVEIYAPPQTRESIAANPELLRPAEVIFSGWGRWLFDQAFLDAAPRLRAIFYGAGGMGNLPHGLGARHCRHQCDYCQFDPCGGVHAGDDHLLA